jgi:acyl-CoA thioester hydrolase
MNHKNSGKVYKSAEIKMTVPFYDLDPLHVVWHGNYLKYFDNARSALFDSLGIDLYGFYKKTKYLFPIIKTSTRHVFPLRHRDEFTVKATVTAAKYKIVTEFEIRLIKDGKICAKGTSEQVAVINQKHDGELEMALTIPEEISKALGF